MQFDWYILGTVLSGMLSAFFGFFVYFNNKEKMGRVFLAFSLSFTLWTLSYAIWLSQVDAIDALFWSRILNLGATFIPIFYLHWVTLALKSELEHKKILIIGYIATILYALFSFSTLYVNKVISVAGFPFWPQAGILYGFFLFTILLPFFCYGIFLLLKTYFSHSTDPILKIQSKYMLIGSILSTVGGVANFLPMFNIPFIAPQFTLLTIFQSMLWAYSSLQYKMFNVKTIATEILVFGLWIFILVRTILFVRSTDQIIEGMLLLVTIVFGIYLIISVNKEVRQREKIEKLATDLKKANTRLLELDKQKSEFVSFATHQLRAPLTAMKGYSSLILEGEMGELNNQVRQAVSRIFDSSKTLANVVDSYLNISRIELGTMKYSFEVINMKELVNDVIGELKPNIEKSGLAFTFTTNPTDSKERFMVHADKDKFKQVIANLIDNSMKYTPKGSMELSLQKNTNNRTITFSVKDTGVGIASEVMPKLFVKFVRADNASKQNIYGTGLGLFVAKEIVTAHKGKIWAESDGEGKGSTFYLEMEMAV